MKSFIKFGLVVGLLSFICGSVSADVFGWLKGITNAYTKNYMVLIVSSEHKDSWIFTESNKIVPGNMYTTNDAQIPMSLIIPWASWDAPADIKVQVLSKKQNDKNGSASLIYQVRLQDIQVNHTPTIRLQFSKADAQGKLIPYETRDFSKMGKYCDSLCSNPCTPCDNWKSIENNTYITLQVEKDGTLSFSASRDNYNNREDGVDSCMATCEFLKN